MNKSANKDVMKTRDKIEALMVALALLVYFALAGWVFQIRPVERDHVASEQIKKAMKLHGVSVAECNDKGCWFYREGQKVRL